jgi:hypothetical protein
MTHAGNVRTVAVFLGPIDRVFLLLSRVENVISVILHDIVVNSIAFVTALWPRLYEYVRHTSSCSIKSRGSSTPNEHKPN